MSVQTFDEYMAEQRKARGWKPLDDYGAPRRYNMGDVALATMGKTSLLTQYRHDDAQAVNVPAGNWAFETIVWCMRCILTMKVSEHVMNASPGKRPAFPAMMLHVFGPRWRQTV